ncbi:hypothetical protein P7C73_g1802, partial [Tremellales sp. Uapishka_1]
MAIWDSDEKNEKDIRAAADYAAKHHEEAYDGDSSIEVQISEKGLSWVQTAILLFTGKFICFLIVVIGHGVQGTPNGWTPKSNTTWTVWAPEGTNFVAGVSALLNIAYTFIGQALIPSFVGDMAHPEDFPKALYLSMALEMIVFTVTGAVVYSHTGPDLTTAPAYGSLISKYGKPAAAMTLPTIIIVGVLYSLVTSRAVYFQIFNEHSIHRKRHTVKGWGIWVAIVFVGWVLAFIIGESIPFFNDLLSLISSLFDSWFGYIFWGIGWYGLNKGRRLAGFGQITQNVLNVIMLITGLFFFGAGTYAAVQSIINSYATGAIKTPFTCVNTGFVFTR